jgi:hypothetical protein
MDRRTALAGMLAAGLATTGCDLLAGDQPPHPLRRLLTDARALGDLYRRTIAGHAGLAERLDPLRKDHQVHVRTLAKLIGPQASASPSGAAPPAVPDDEPAAMDALRKAEQDAAGHAVKLCLKTSREYAGLVGSIAACRTVHLEVLG